MHGNTYAGVVEAWKVDLILGRARLMGFRRHDLEDVQQEIVLDLLDFRFDPARSNGATETTVLTSLVDRRLRTIRRSRRRYEQQIERMKADAAAAEGCPPCEDADPDGLALDVRCAVATLPAEEQSLCLALSRGDSISQVARDLGCSWHAANRMVGQIRRRFAAAGLDGWIRD